MIWTEEALVLDDKLSLRSLGEVVSPCGALAFLRDLTTILILISIIVSQISAHFALLISYLPYVLVAGRREKYHNICSMYSIISLSTLPYEKYF
jgi:hypothetical protein